MNSRWPARPFEELTRNYDAIRIPVKESERRPGPYPYYGASGVVDFVDGFLFDGDYMLVAEDGENLRTRQTPVAFMARGKFWVNNHAHIVTANDENDTCFLMYAMRVADISGYLTGSAMPKLTQGNLNRIPVIAPPLEKQLAIAEVLSSLDETIDLNARTSQKLEQIVATIFKAWFIDFEPIKAKAAGSKSFPSMQQSVFDNLPTTFDHRTTGAVPTGWKVGTIGDVGIQLRNQAAPKDFNPLTPYIGLEHMPRRSTVLGLWGVADGLESVKFKFNRGNILFGKLRPYFHKVGRAVIDGVCSTDIIVISPRQSIWSAWLLCMVSTESFVAYADSASTGTKMPRTNWDFMSRYSVAIPPQETASAFDSLVRPMLDQIGANIHVNRGLTSLRDAILPKLLSGEVQVQ